jgi:hypothetical protein
MMVRGRSTFFTAVLVAALALTACNRSASNKASEAAGPPAGGWPQAADGKLDQKMCGLLTPADYAKYGHALLPRAGGDDSGKSGNSVSCLYMTGDELALNLQPTAEGAKLLFQRELGDHGRRMKEKGLTSQLAKDVVAGADESWFDLSFLGTDKYPEYEVHVRRGALLVLLRLSTGSDKDAKDPKAALVGLAGLVLERAPDLGKKDTGTLHKVKYVVTGTAKAKSINYYDPGTGKSVDVGPSPLPWTVEIALASEGKNPVLLQVNAVADPATAFVGCAITVDGKPLTEQKVNRGLNFCNGQYAETS